MDLHDRPFDEGTKFKLNLFELYTKEWIPTFVMSNCKVIWIFDFFAGTGYDKVGVPGSPILILKQINEQINNIFAHCTKINVCFNEFSNKKFTLLTNSCEKYCITHPELKKAIDSSFVKIQYVNKDFAVLFPEMISTIRKYPSLLFLDQNGVKFIADKYFNELIKTKTTDFLYYLSSSYILRFYNTPEFKNNIQIDIEKARENPYKYIHMSILEQIREKIPFNSSLKLYPFTIKKSRNIYGIIFGASHPRAVDKFLKSAWIMNPKNGDANFDIDADEQKMQLDLFAPRQLSKIEKFSRTLRTQILDGKIKTNKDAFEYTLEQGHIDKHANNEIIKMKQEGLIKYDSRTPLVNYDQVYKKKRIIDYIIIKNENDKNRMDR